MTATQPCTSIDPHNAHGHHDGTWWHCPGRGEPVRPVAEIITRITGTTPHQTVKTLDIAAFGSSI